jgi:hypothetical protein
VAVGKTPQAPQPQRQYIHIHTYTYIYIYTYMTRRRWWRCFPTATAAASGGDTRSSSMPAPAPACHVQRMCGLVRQPQLAMITELGQSSQILALPPSLSTCTRDRYPPTLSLAPAVVLPYTSLTPISPFCLTPISPFCLTPISPYSLARACCVSALHQP